MGLVLRIPKGSRLTWAELDGDFTYLSSSIVDLSSSFAAAIETIGVGATLQASLLPNQTVGGIKTPFTTYAVGTELETILRDMLVSYVKPAFTSFSIRSGSTAITTAAREVGSTFIVNTASFAASVDNPDGNYPYNVSITSSGASVDFDQLLVAGEASPSTNIIALSSDRTMTTSGTATSISFILNGTTSAGAAISQTSITVPFRFKNYLAASATILTNASSDATVQTVAVSETTDSELLTGTAWTATCTSANADPTKYTYIIYPSNYSQISSIKQNGSQDVTSAFTRLTTTFTITNASGGTLTVQVYKSNQPGAFANGTNLEIT